MSKAPSSSVVAKEAKGWGTIIVLCIAGFIFLPALLTGAVKAMAPSAEQMTKPIPGNANRLNEQSQAGPTPTTAAPKPYGPPNGNVKPVIPTNQLPPPSIPPTRPEVGESTGGILGPLLGDIPAVGPALESGVRAISPGLTKALKP